MQEQSNVGFDRLARSSRDLQNILHELQEIGCGFVSLGETWCDTRPANGRPNSQS
jgi:DNA invertase Pin-like site-specific DNA recombinase